MAGRRLQTGGTVTAAAMGTIGATFRFIGQDYRKGKTFLYHKQPCPYIDAGGWGEPCDSVIKVQWVQGMRDTGLGGDCMVADLGIGDRGVGTAEALVPTKF